MEGVGDSIGAGTVHANSVVIFVVVRTGSGELDNMLQAQAVWVLVPVKSAMTRAADAFIFLSTKPHIMSVIRPEV